MGKTISRQWLMGAGCCALSLVMVAAGHPALAGQVPVHVSPLPDFSARCQALNGVHDPDLGEIISAGPGESRLEPNPWNPAPAPLPSHCDVIGKLQPRKGQLGQSFAITYHLRMPQAWNGRFLLQGGAGSNGEMGDATGPVGGLSRAIDRGFAVLSHDSGHDNRRNNDPAHGGVTVFGTDPQARANYGHAALPLVTRAGKSMVSRFYGKRPGKSYFFGCSKGGQEGMALAQRYPGLYDGIVAGAPGFSLPRAALNQAWSLQQFGRLARQQTGQSPTPASIAHAFSTADMQLLARGVLQACDKLDGLADGIVGHPLACTASRVLPRLRKLQCSGDKTASCLAGHQIDMMARLMAGPKGRGGKPLYSSWAWDPGMASPLWAMWRTGSDQMPAMDITLGGASLASVFTVPPRAVASDPQSLLDYALSLDFPRAEGLIYATSAQFPRSAWQDIGMRSPDLDGMMRAGGKLLVYHGVADPVFSLRDTAHWSAEVKARYGAAADRAVRLYAVPGMAHCGGGPATDQFDMLGAMVDWVERRKAPERILATAGPGSPWPGRQRPLCPWPAHAQFMGGAVDDPLRFKCRK